MSQLIWWLWVGWIISWSIIAITYLILLIKEKINKANAGLNKKTKEETL